MLRRMVLGLLIVRSVVREGSTVVLLVILRETQILLLHSCCLGVCMMLVYQSGQAHQISRLELVLGACHAKQLTVCLNLEDGIFDVVLLLVSGVVLDNAPHNLL